PPGRRRASHLRDAARAHRSGGRPGALDLRLPPVVGLRERWRGCGGLEPARAAECRRDGAADRATQPRPGAGRGSGMRRFLLLAVALAVAAADLLPLALVLKQAVTPERESFAWPPTWFPHAFTAENFRAVTAAVELGRGIALSLLVAGLTVGATLALAVPAAWLAARHR